MAQIECWLCGGRGERQLVLRPGGVPDGRRVCKVCVRRLFASIHRMSPEERAAWAARLWRRGVVEPAPPEEPWRGELRSAFCEQVREALLAGDDLGRVETALGYFGMQMVPEGLEALAAVDPAAFDPGTLPTRLLNSLLSRMLDEAAMNDGARELVQSSLYPGA